MNKSLELRKVSEFTVHNTENGSADGYETEAGKCD
jgi:hypothetical protein